MAKNDSVVVATHTLGEVPLLRSSSNVMVSLHHAPD